MTLIQRAPLLTAAWLLTLVKSVQFAIDSQALFFFDSPSFILNALGLAFRSERSYVYGDLIRIFALPFHSLRAIVLTHVIMGGLTAWLLVFALVRMFYVRAWIAILAGLVFAFDPVQIVHEHMVMTETTALLAMAVFLVVALQYLRDASVPWLVLLSFVGILLVSLRFVYLPLVLAAAVSFPVVTYWSSPVRSLRLLALALLVSCGSTALFHVGYQHLTGRLAGREPAYQYMSGFFLLATVAPIVEPGDSGDVRVVQAVIAQNQSSAPLGNRGGRSAQLWDSDGMVARLRAVFDHDERKADRAAQTLARATILRNPLGFVWLGVRTYSDYWREIPVIREFLRDEDGSGLRPEVGPDDARVIFSVFGVDVANQNSLMTPSRRYHLFARYWSVFLLAAPFLAALAMFLRPANPEGVALLLVWTCLLLAATCLGGTEASYRYLHPLSFTGLAATAILAERLASRP